jgi:hypothetical protein
MTQPPAPEQRLIVTSEPDDWITRARRYTRPLVEAEGWSDEDIDRVIEEERAAVQPERLIGCHYSRSLWPVIARNEVTKQSSLRFRIVRG